ncbi:MAG: hypothetical protein QG671_2045 [Actinomycetota bacterium]|nr:hypothetical protein [Actinomycetota bacterium]
MAVVICLPLACEISSGVAMAQVSVGVAAAVARAPASCDGPDFVPLSLDEHPGAMNKHKTVNEEPPNCCSRSPDLPRRRHHFYAATS